MRNNLKQIRKIKGITQQQLADHLGVSKAMVSMWENNPNEKIPQDRAKPIADFLNVDVKDLFAAELDVEAIEREALEEEIQRLADRYEQIVKDDEQIIDEIQSINSAIQAQLQRMHESSQWERVRDFSTLLNDLNIHTLFDNKIRPYSFEAFMDRLLRLLKEQDHIKIRILHMVIDYLSEVDETSGYEWREGIFSTYVSFKEAFDNFLQQSNLKGENRNDDS